MNYNLFINLHASWFGFGLFLLLSCMVTLVVRYYFATKAQNDLDALLAILASSKVYDLDEFKRLLRVVDLDNQLINISSLYDFCIANNVGLDYLLTTYSQSPTEQIKLLRTLYKHETFVITESGVQALCKSILMSGYGDNISDADINELKRFVLFQREQKLNTYLLHLACESDSFYKQEIFTERAQSKLQIELGNRFEELQGVIFLTLLRTNMLTDSAQLRLENKVSELILRDVSGFELHTITQEYPNLHFSKEVYRKSQRFFEDANKRRPEDKVLSI